MSSARVHASLVAASVVVTLAALVLGFAGDGISLVEGVLLPLFAVLHAMLGAGFWFAVLGLVARPRPPAPARQDGDATGQVRTAIVVPVFHEDAGNVFARIQAMHAALDELGALDAFDIFVLSDSRDPKAQLAEEAAWLATCRRLDAFERLFYRRRPDNEGRKSGNVADFCRRWGDRYNYMIVLDADSLMAASTLTELVRRMEAEPTLALLQTRPLECNARSLFARTRQFAGTLYGDLFGRGLSRVQGDAAFYWGHNAIIRMQAFTQSCGLPELAGPPPMGGPILSHDFVESALLVRDGWKVRIDPDLDGSLEEGPPTLIDFAKRDRRWCQGNLQHGRVLFAEGLHPMSRGNFLLGIMAYLSGFLWFLFLVVLIAAAVVGAIPEPSGAGALARWANGFVLASTGIYLFGPKLLALGRGLASRARRRRFGGAWAMIASTVAETLFSALIAPTMMLLHTRFVLAVLFGREVGWNPQRRDTDRVSWSEAVRAHGWDTAVGLGLGTLAAIAAPTHFWWLLPVVAGMVLIVPVSVLSSRSSWGAATTRLGLFLVPQELSPPAELSAYRSTVVSEPGEDLLADPVLAALHITVAGDGGIPPGASPDDRERFLAKHLDAFRRAAPREAG